MKNQGVSRRRFLALCGGGFAGIWLAGTGFVPLPSEMVFAMSGWCSFCGKEAKEIFGLAGITHRNSRICNECIELCFDILAEEVDIGPHDATTAEAALSDSHLLEDLRRRVAAGELGDPLVDATTALLAQLEEIVKRPPTPTRRVEDLSCSFCDKHQDNIAKLIAGPTDYICDGCVGDAGALFMRYGWRPGT
jgi:hypothetical protein